MDTCLPAARAAARRRKRPPQPVAARPAPLPASGATSSGPKTPAGETRAARNAGRGPRAEPLVAGESLQQFLALEAALQDDLAPDGALQHVLVGRIARAAWRLSRAERIETELLEAHTGSDGSLGAALLRDGQGSRALDTLLRYRGAAMAELWRALRLLKALQAEAAEAAHAPHAVPGAAPPIEPEARGNPRLIAFLPRRG